MRIAIKCSPSGQVKVMPQGFEGSEQCHVVAKPFLDALLAANPRLQSDVVEGEIPVEGLVSVAEQVSLEQQITVR